MKHMRFKSDSNMVVKRKLFTVEKKWAIVSTLSFAGILLGGALTGVDVRADSDVVGTSDTVASSSTTTNDPNVVQDQDQSVTANVTIQSNLGAITVNDVTGNEGQTVPVTVPVKTEYKADKSMVIANVNNDGTITTDETVDYTAIETNDDQTNSESISTYSLASAPVENGENDVSTDDTTADTNNIVDSGQFGTSNWTIDDTGVLHIGAGELGSRNDEYWVDSNYSNNITSIQIDDSVTANEDSSYLFEGLKNVTQINGLNKLDTSNVTNMSRMFSGMSAVKDLDLSSFDTSNVTSMGYMFSDMSAVKDLDLSSFDTSKVTIMQYMFSNMSSIKNLDLSSFDTSNVMNMQAMFAVSSSLQALDISNFDMFSNKNTRAMFGSTNIYKLKLGKKVVFLKNDRPTPFPNVSPEYYAVGSGTENDPKGEKDGGELTDVFNKYLTPAEQRDNNEQYSKFDETYVRTEDATLLVSVPYSDESRESYEIKETAHGVPGNEVTADIEIPAVEGYTLYQNGTKLVADDDGNYLVTISGTIEGPDDNEAFNVSTNDHIEYRQNPVSGTVTIPSNHKDPVEVEASGEKGTIITIDVPGYPGYTADKETVEVSIDEDGNFSVVDPTGAGYVTYTKNPTNNGGGSSTSTPTSEITDVNIDVATFADQPAARLYDTQGQLITNRALQPNTCWFADKKLTRDGVSYYRVATDEWVKMDDVYVYTANNKFIKTYNDSSKDLLNAHQVKLGRQLRANSDWVTDIYTYMNGTKYYRVGSNEFVSADDALEYTPIHAVVQTNNYNVTVYDERGHAVTNRQLTANSSWITDKTAVIDGFTMYRVATDEWVRAVDVVNVKEN
ncbi:BspA family leucine-rich repeat surface protein [Companilactobacillus sp. HBUAS59699]|uniref:BspA family leucine-rich repeat surface protein n=1 Tax=Companilactobacillus sp. HBUAS59699 TaxID=3109358 RepID=UPI002FF1BE6C